MEENTNNPVEAQLVNEGVDPVADETTEA